MKKILTAIGFVTIFCGSALQAEQAEESNPFLDFVVQSYSIVELRFDGASVPSIEATSGPHDGRAECETALLTRLQEMDQDHSYQVYRNAPHNQLVLDWNGKGEVFFLCVETAYDPSPFEGTSESEARTPSTPTTGGGSDASYISDLEEFMRTFGPKATKRMESYPPEERKRYLEGLAEYFDFSDSDLRSTVFEGIEIPGGNQSGVGTTDSGSTEPEALAERMTAYRNHPSYTEDKRIYDDLTDEDKATFVGLLSKQHDIPVEEIQQMMEGR